MNNLLTEILATDDPSQVAGLSRFFKTGPGQYGITLLGQIPIVQSIREGGDCGEPAALGSRPDSLAFMDLAGRIAG